MNVARGFIVIAPFYMIVGVVIGAQRGDRGIIALPLPMPISTCWVSR